MLVPELMLGQQLSVYDFLKDDVTKWKEFVAKFSHSSVLKMNGNAFHTSSCGHWTIAVLLLQRLILFGRDDGIAVEK